MREPTNLPRVLGALIACGLLGGCQLTAPTPTDAELEAAFAAPPIAAAPWAYWFVMDGNLTRDGITADLEAMRAAGLGGVIFLEVDVGIPRGPVKFMSPEWRALFAHAVAECKRLGLQLTLNAGPGWTGSGGPWVTPEQSMQHLVASTTEVEGPRHFDAVLQQPAPRPPFFGDGHMPAELRARKDAFHRDVSVLAFPSPATAARIDDLDEKALYVRAPYSSQRGVKPFLPAPASFDEPPRDAVITADAILDLGQLLDATGRLRWDVPAGRWTILRFCRTSTGANTRPAPLPGLGLECDKFDAAALDAHFAAFVEPLLAATGTPNADGAGWTMLHIDSWEMSAQNWTAAFRAEFTARRGYDPLPYLPTLTGRIVGSREHSERFLWDLRQTGQELVLDRHARHLQELGRRHGLGLSIEPYDMNPCADMSLGGLADVPMCEFWAMGFDTDYSCFEATSIAHTLGRAIVAAESFTSDDRERWRLYPGALKAQGDWAFATGINRIVFHRYQHQPVLDAAPGMTMGPYGVHWERTQTWWPMVSAYHRYLARCQYLLRRGASVADICFVVPEGAPQVFLPPASALRGALPDHRGHAFDGCAPEVVRDLMTVRDGAVELPGGARYRLLVLPAFATMTPALLAKIVQLVEGGACVVGAPPKASPSLSGYPDCDAEVQRLAARLWGDGAAPDTVTTRRVGRGTVVWGGDIGRAAAAAPSPLAGAQWIWHREGAPASSAMVGERHFRRTLEVPADRALAQAQFAITADNEFVLRINDVEVARGDDFHELYTADVASLLHAGTNVIAITVQNGGNTPNPAGLIGNLQITFRDGGRLSVPTDALWQSRADGGFGAAMELGPVGMAPWGESMLPAVRPELYPTYDVLAALLAQQGVPADCEASTPLRFAHRRDGARDLYFVANPDDRTVATTVTFRVTGRQPELWDPITGERRLLPDFAVHGDCTEVPLRLLPQQSYFVVFRTPATSATAQGANFRDLAELAIVTGPWQVHFQPGCGAPEALTFATLTDWSQHALPGVRHFSGIAAYTTSFELPADWRADGRVFIDLGAVQVMAGVHLNGRDLGVAWTAPFHLDASEALRPGHNELQLRVANLWPNRLIGDAALPAAERVAQTTWNPFTADTPLLPSGLLGPVTLRATPRWR